MPTVPTEDRVQLSDLVARYALNVDERHLDVIAGLFTQDAVLVLPDPPATLHPVLEHVGRDAVHAALSTVSRVPQTFHAITGEVYDVGPDPDQLTGVVACSAHHLSRNSSDQVIDRVWNLRYRDAYRRTDDGWRFARRELHLATVDTRQVRAWRGDAGA